MDLAEARHRSSIGSSPTGAKEIGSSLVPWSKRTGKWNSSPSLSFPSVAVLIIQLEISLRVSSKRRSCCSAPTDWIRSNDNKLFNTNRTFPMQVQLLLIFRLFFFIVQNLIRFFRCTLRVVTRTRTWKKRRIRIIYNVNKQVYKQVYNTTAQLHPFCRVYTIFLLFNYFLKTKVLHFGTSLSLELWLVVFCSSLNVLMIFGKVYNQILVEHIILLLWSSLLDFCI